MSSKRIEDQTKKLFSKLHLDQLNDDRIFGRLKILLSTEFFKVKKNFFSNKICLDAGCGLNLNATINLLNLGAKYVFACDLNHRIKKLNKTKFKKYDKRYQVRQANLKNLPYKDKSFDFVHCAGAIHHTTNYKKSIKELCRTVKKGGYIYIEAYGSGGLIRDITSFLRKKVLLDKKFKKFIKDLDEKKLRDFFLFILDKKYKKKIFELIDKDLVLTIKDRLLSPLYVEFSDKEIVKILKQENFHKIKRLKRKPYFRNLRKYLTKIYFNYNNEYSRLLYGSGMPCVFAKKK